MHADILSGVKYSIFWDLTCSELMGLVVNNGARSYSR